MTSKPVLTPREAAELLGVGYKTILRLSKRADFPAFELESERSWFQLKGCGNGSGERWQNPLIKHQGAICKGPVHKGF